MSIRSASIPIGATFAPTGGTARGFLLAAETGFSVSYLLNDGATFPNRIFFNASVVSPKAKADGPSGYTQRRARLNIQIPTGVTVGSSVVRTVNTISIELSADPFSAASDITALRSAAINAINDSDFDDLWNSNSLG